MLDMSYNWDFFQLHMGLQQILLLVHANWENALDHRIALSFVLAVSLQYWLQLRLTSPNWELS
jgi:hypothetical protein